VIVEIGDPFEEISERLAGTTRGDHLRDPPTCAK